MTVVASTFRQQYQAFNDPGTYPDASINGYLAASTGLLNADRWGALLDLGTSLYIAHNLVLDARDTAVTNNGGVPGAPQGVLTAKTVDKVSASYDAQSIAMDGGAGDFNMTTYGIRFLRLARLIGSGGMQLSGGVCDPNVQGNVGVGCFPWT